jgi:serine/threonine-protein kinase RsbW
MDMGEAGAVSEGFTLSGLRRVRDLVGDASRVAGLAETEADNLLTAVNEIAVNAILYAGGHGSVTVESSPDGVMVRISDDGPGLPVGSALSGGPVPAMLPEAGAIGGRGLWLARHLCPEFDLTSTPTGLTVRLFMRRG